MSDVKVKSIVRQTVFNIDIEVGTILVVPRCVGYDDAFVEDDIVVAA